MSYSSEVLADSPILYPRLGESAAMTIAATSASSSHGTGPVARAFDSNTATEWTSNGTSTGWIKAQLSAAFALTSYSLWGRRAATPNRSPKDWTFEGSNDDSTWDVLDTQTNQTWSADERKNFTFANTTAYLYYRLNISANTGDTYVNVMELSLALAKDSSGNGRGGRYLNAPTLGVAGALSGDADTAATFASASAQDMQVLPDPAFDITTLTLECWVKTTATNQAIVGRGGGTSVPYSLFVNGSGALQLVIKNSGTSGVNYDGSATINDGAWHYVAAVRDDATDEVWLYVDGAEDAYFASTVVPQTLATAGFHVASRGGSAYLDGSVDEPALYNTALSPTRIAAHYAAATGGSTAASGSGTLTLSGSGGAVAPVSGAGALSLAGSGAATAPASGSGSIEFSGVGGTVAPEAAAGAGSLTLSGAGGVIAALSGSGALSLSGAGSAVLAASGSGLLTLTGGGEALQLFETDTSNASNGRRRGAIGTVTITRPVAAPPAGMALATKVDKAVAYPTPTMVNGRPT